MLEKKLISSKFLRAFIFNATLLLTPFEIFSASPPVFKTGDTLRAFFWSQTSDNITGFYGKTKIWDQVTDTGVANFPAKFTLVRCPWWLNMVLKKYNEININFNNSKPDSVEFCSEKFSNVSWLRSINGHTDTAAYFMRFYFPILPLNVSYKQFDYFSVILNDSMRLQFQGISDSTMAGSFISKKSGKPTVMDAKNAITVLTTTAKPLRIKSIQINGAYEQLSSSYLGFKLSELKNPVQYYGIDIVDAIDNDTVPVPQKIQLLSMTLAEAPSLLADSTYRVSWSLSGKSSLDQCSLYVSLDSGKTWGLTKVIAGPDTSCLWTAPSEVYTHCFLKIAALGTIGQKSEIQSSEFFTKIIVQALNAAILKAPNLFIDSTYTVTWSLLGKSVIDRCSLYVSIDSGTTWTPAGMTLGADSVFLLKAPAEEYSHCFFKVLALGKQGQRGEAQSMEFRTIKTIQVLAISLTGTPDLFIDSTYRVSWSLSGNSAVDRCSLFVSIDSGITWAPAGMTLGADTVFSWKATSEEHSHCFFKVLALGKQGQKSEMPSSEFKIKIPVFAFAISLSGSPNLFADSTYRLSWSLSGQSVIDRCSLFVSLDSGAVWFPVGMSSGTDTSMLWTAPPKTSSHCFIKITTFGKQGQKSEALSPEFKIKINSQTPISILPTNDTLPVNNYSLSWTPLDSLVVRLAWSLTGSIDTSVKKIGIRFSTQQFPSSMKDSLSDTVGIFGLKETCDTIRNLKRGTPYYYSLFVANEKGYWSGATQNSMQRVYIAIDTLSIQAVKLGLDTQSVFHDSLKLWVEPKLVLPYIDTIDPWLGAVDKKGFVQIGPGFSLRHGNISTKTELAVKIKYGGVPAGFSAGDLRVYQYDIYKAKWRLIDGPITIDSAGHTVQAKTKDAGLPFMVMIDTSAPLIEKHIKNQDIATINERIIDTVFISDNIENISLKFLAGPGNQSARDITLYMTPGEKTNEYILSIPPYVADQNSGLRGFLIINDGRYIDTINISRKIKREKANCDNKVISAVQWTPLTVTAQPENPHLSAILSPLNGDTMPLISNKKEMRIIQWLPLPENSATTDKWVEYEAPLDSLFNISLGKLLWIKTRKEFNTGYDTAVLPNLIDTFKVTLNQNNWTDFSIPYNFDLFLNDVIEATKKASGPSADSLRIYRWIKNGTDFSTDPLFITNLISDTAKTTKIHGGEAFSVFNPLSQPMSLCIPPIDTSYSSVSNKTPQKKRSGSEAWNVKIRIISNDSNYLSPIYCASLPKDKMPRYFPISPSLSSIKIGVLDQTKREFGHVASGDLTNGGTIFDIFCSNNSNAPCPIKLFIESKSGLPQGIKTGLFSVKDSAVTRDTIKIDLDVGQKTTCEIVVGSGAYLKNFFRAFTSPLSLRVISHNRSLKILYTLPYETKLVKCALYDLRGRIIFEKHLQVRALSSEGSMSLQNLLGKGFYLVELKAFIEGQDAKVLRKKVVYVR
jgi:hypothetical protein